MALSIASARASVKSRLDIPSGVTSFDTVIDEFVQSAVNRLWPATAQEVDAQTVAVTVDSYGETIVTLGSLPTAVTSARSVEASAGYNFSPIYNFYHHGTKLKVQDLSSDITTLRIYGLTPYVLTTVPDYLAPAIFWYAMSEFYDYLVGNKRKYNIYQQAGARLVDNMAQESNFYSDKAQAFVNEHSTVY